MQGNCLCGKVVFEILSPIRNLYQCHCSLCRKQGGSASNTATFVADNAFRWLAGQGNVTSWVKPTGFRSDFCSTCGSPVPNPLRTSGYWWIPAGLLDGALEAEVVAHLFVASAAKWDRISPAPHRDTTRCRASRTLSGSCIPMSCRRRGARFGGARMALHEQQCAGPRHRHRESNTERGRHA